MDPPAPPDSRTLMSRRALQVSAGESSDLLCATERGEDVEAPPLALGRRSLKRAATVALVAAALVATATAAMLGKLGRKAAAPGAARSVMVKQETYTPAFDSLCGKMDVDYEYQDEQSGWGVNYDHIPTPEMCCAMCQGVPECMAFTWVKDAGLEGCPSQCWLKGGPGTKVPKKGLVSGVPPPRKKLGNLPTGVDGPGGSLFCFSLMVPGGYEADLLKWQYKHRASIFGCDGVAVYSNKKLKIAPGVSTTVIDSDLKCTYGGDSMSALNSWIFIALLDKLLDDGLYKKHDWVVKVDPDCVFFPDRLSTILMGHSGAGYINNCKYGMHGPIEVFSTDAMNTLSDDYKASWDGKAPNKCATDLHFGQWGEDMFLDQCLGKVLEVSPRPLEPRLMCEAHCDCPAWYWCQNGTDRVSYHPFKSVESYENCMANAMDGKSAPASALPPPVTAATSSDDADATEDEEEEEEEEGDVGEHTASSASEEEDETSSSLSSPSINSAADKISSHYLQGFKSQCGHMNENIEYQDDVSGYGVQFDNIPTPEMCCALCQGDPKCEAFTWVKDAGLEGGNPSQCWLKGAEGTPIARAGVISGVPPKRMQLYGVPRGIKGPGGSLFCFSLMVPESTEVQLLKWQFDMKASIFTCDGYAVFSNKALTITPGVVTKVIDSDLKCEYGGDSQSALNTWIFIAVWEKLIDDGEYLQHEWVVKVDPDAVFFPDRLGRMLAEHKGAAYINNCKYGLHGPIEVFSTAAIGALAKDYGKSWDGKAPHTCVSELHFGQWGEDMFIDQCLHKVLQLSPRPTDERLMCESHCECPAWYWCNNGTDRVSFHPFKTVDAYSNCMANALAAAPAGVPATEDVAEVPSQKELQFDEAASGGLTSEGESSSDASSVGDIAGSAVYDDSAVLPMAMGTLGETTVFPTTVPPPGPTAETFYVYRAQSAAHYPLSNLNAADLEGVLWYLHNEVITSTPRKYGVDRIKRYKITVKNTYEFWNVHHRQFGAFVAYDAARCTTPVCADIYNSYGFIVGCQVVDIALAGYRGKTQTTWSCEKGSDQCYAPLWYSLPGQCPLEGLTNNQIAGNQASIDVNSAKSTECIAKAPGGLCDQASGAPDCTYSYMEAGEIMLDELTGINDYHEFWNTSYTKCAEQVAKGLLDPDTKCVHQKEYVPFMDQGVGCTFWDDKLDKDACATRVQAVEALFKKHYPHLPASLKEPPCDFDMYYEDEFSWKTNHTGATPSTYWDNRMPVPPRATGA